MAGMREAPSCTAPGGLPVTVSREWAFHCLCFCHCDCTVLCRVSCRGWGPSCSSQGGKGASSGPHGGLLTGGSSLLLLMDPPLRAPHGPLLLLLSAGVVGMSSGSWDKAPISG